MIVHQVINAIHLFNVAPNRKIRFVIVKAYLIRIMYGLIGPTARPEPAPKRFQTKWVFCCFCTSNFVVDSHLLLVRVTWVPHLQLIAVLTLKKI